MLVKLTGEISAILDSKGAELISLTDEFGTEYVWQKDPKFWKGACPILFPIVGALRDDKSFIYGKEINMKKHGFARKTNFKVIDQTATSVTFSLRDDFEIRKMYPFSFELQLTYFLVNRSLHQRFTVINKSDSKMPYVVGAHPGFNVPFDPKETSDTFEQYSIIFDQVETCDTPRLNSNAIIETTQREPVLENTNTLPLKHDYFNDDALILESLKSRKVTLLSTLTGKGVEVAFPDFNILGIWQAKNAPYVCIEPWTGVSTLDTEGDKFEEKFGMVELEAGETAEHNLIITVL